MPIDELEYEVMRYRSTVVSVALQALIGRLTTSGTLDHGDLVAMREIGLELAADLGRAKGRPEIGARLTAETDAWWNAVGSLCSI